LSLHVWWLRSMLSAHCPVFIYHFPARYFCGYEQHLYVCILQWSADGWFWHVWRHWNVRRSWWTADCCQSQRKCIWCCVVRCRPTVVRFNIFLLCDVWRTLYNTCARCDHLSGIPGNVVVFGSCWKNVGEKIFCRKNRLLLAPRGQQYSAVRGFSRCAAEFTVCRGICRVPWENAELAFFATCIPNSMFFGPPFNFTSYKTKSSCCKLTFVIIMSIMTWMTWRVWNVETFTMPWECSPSTQLLWPFSRWTWISRWSWSPFSFTICCCPLHSFGTGRNFAHQGQSPAYLNTAAAQTLRSGLRSASTTNYAIPRQLTEFGERAFPMLDQQHGILYHTNSELHLPWTVLSANWKHFFDTAFNR